MPTTPDVTPTSALQALEIIEARLTALEALIPHVQELFDVFIEGGYIEAGDESFIDPLYEFLKSEKNR